MALVGDLPIITLPISMNIILLKSIYLFTVN